MKFNLTITDATLDELRSFLGRGDTVRMAKAVVTTAPIIESPVESAEFAENPEGAPDFDSAGFRWDERIHSANKGTNTNGTWRRRRGVDDATIAAVESELKPKNTGYVATPVMIMPTGDTSESVDAPVMMTPQQFEQPIAPAMPDPIAPAPTPVIGATTIDFGGFMHALAQKSSTGAIDTAYIVNLTQRTGDAIGRQMLAITDVMTIPEGIVAAVQIMQQDGKW